MEVMMMMMMMMMMVLLMVLLMVWDPDKEGRPFAAGPSVAAPVWEGQAGHVPSEGEAHVRWFECGLVCSGVVCGVTCGAMVNM
jgi:hypothetical protein